MVLQNHGKFHTLLCGVRPGLWAWGRGHSCLVQRIIPEIRIYFAKALTKANSRDIRL
ncbi:ARM REPEAT PROTEIN INTERACTING WITH ABF2 [Senna tora]|uniref:ARM REPEAT PROTEIN INTERACTING WITH ABF2 n=1 Tax=Senna tora TaxID=362788 RepID=A0A834X2H4_9FABA|nr:ARM REPEAT PROTEIN INTERACTING WITH ABF2 [Senna tora]